jgi:hypothetical protein
MFLVRGALLAATAVVASADYHFFRGSNSQVSHLSRRGANALRDTFLVELLFQKRQKRE